MIKKDYIISINIKYYYLIIIDERIKQRLYLKIIALIMQETLMKSRFTVKEIANHLGATPQTIYNEIRREKLRSGRVGRRLM